MVKFSEMSKETRTAWTKLCESSGFIDISGYDPWMPTEVAAVMFFWLREIPDTAANFPKGKWASIQYFDTLVSAGVRNDLADLKSKLEADYGR